MEVPEIHFDARFTRVATAIMRRKQIVAKLNLPHLSFCNKFIQQNITLTNQQQHDNIKQYISNIASTTFSTGYKLQYWNKEANNFVPSKYKTLKEEILTIQYTIYQLYNLMLY